MREMWIKPIYHKEYYIYINFLILLIVLCLLCKRTSFILEIVESLEINQQYLVCSWLKLLRRKCIILSTGRTVVWMFPPKLILKFDGHRRSVEGEIFGMWLGREGFTSPSWVGLMLFKRATSFLFCLCLAIFYHVMMQQMLIPLSWTFQAPETLRKYTSVHYKLPSHM